MKQKMKTFTMFVVCALVLNLFACSSSETTADGELAETEMTWQDYYNLGVRYLSEGNYEEAILAFTAAIEIDPKQALAYVGRGDAYVLSEETAENLAAAKTDYETAIELDKMLEDVYSKLAEIYQKQGDGDAAQQILQQGFEITGSEELQRWISELSKLKRKEGYPKTERWDYEDGEGYEVHEYDEYGQTIKHTVYNADDTIDSQNIYEYDECGNEIYNKFYSSKDYFLLYEDSSYTKETYYDQFHRVIEQNSKHVYNEQTVKYDYSNCPTVVISAHTIGAVVDLENQNLSCVVTYQMQNVENIVDFVGYGQYGSVIADYIIDEKDADGKAIKETIYWLDGSIRSYYIYTWTDGKCESEYYVVNETQPS